MKEKIKLFIIDDHELLREGIQFYLETFDNLEVTGEAGSAEEFFEKIDNVRFDVAVIDLNLPGASGLEIVKRLSTEYPFIRMIIYSANIDEESIISTVRAGVHGYIPKVTAKKELPAAIEAVYKGDRYISPSITETLMSAFHKARSEEEVGSVEPLSDREKRIAGLIAEGLSYKEIGAQLNISDRTVETHKNNILKKLNLTNKVELVKYAIKEGLAKL